MTTRNAGLHILTIDDDPVDRETYRRFLDHDGDHPYDVLEAETAESGLEIVRSREIDCILLDYNLPDADGLEVLRELAEARIEVPVIMLTGEGSESIAMAAIRRGGQDYVIKSDLTAPALLRVIQNAIERAGLQRELRRKEEALERTRRRELEFKDELLSHVSHELRTPLTAIHQFLSILLEGPEGELSGQQREFLDIAFRNAKQLAKLIGDLTDASRIQAGKLRVEPRPVALQDEIPEIVHSLEASATAREISLRCEFAEELPPALADDGRLRQILTNLIENAIKFTPEMGSIAVAVRRDRDDADFVRVSVSDTGCGISEEGVRKVFDRLHQEQADRWESRKGMGIGLHLCKELVSRQAGKIWVESKLGHGSSFHFTLPVFSLAKIVQKAVVCGRIRHAYGIIRVDLAPADPGASTGIPEGLSRGIYHTLSTVIYPAVDVLLPRFFRAGIHETYWIVAGTDTEGMKSLVQRIRTCLSDQSDVDYSKVRIHVDGHIEETPAVDHQIPLEEAVHNVARRIEQLMQAPGG